jgi:pyruvate-ferredoxin/flavodoxin oxidoreductase
MEHGLRQQKLAVESGYWPLLRFNPLLKDVGQNPMTLDSRRGKIPLQDYAYNETRYRVLTRSDPERAAELLKLAQHAVDERWANYEMLATSYAGGRSNPPAVHSEN